MVAEVSDIAEAGKIVIDVEVAYISMLDEIIKMVEISKVATI